jgi:two-component system phosphate regulon sensor histidine kinase PhoR
MPSVWLSLIGQLLVVACLGLLAGAWMGSIAGLSAACAGLLLMSASHVAYLARLQRWLKKPEEREIPDAWGAWGNVFVDLYRMLRREGKMRARILAELELFKQASSALPDGIVLLDAQDHIVWCNGMAERHLGISLEQDAGLILTHFVRQPRFAEFLAESVRGATFAYQPQQNPGQTLSIEAIPFEENRKLVVSFDVTQTERVETMRRDFVANVSHELRTPLTVIGGFLEHLVEDGGGDPAQLRYQLGLVDEQTRRMLRLVDDLLTLSRLEAADNLPREDYVNMSELIGEVVDEGCSLSAGRHVLAPDVCAARLKGCREELRSAFSNLVSNAVRYTPDGGRIALRWKIEDGKGVFSVEDSGIGIAGEHLPRLTERFYRVDHGRSRESGGTGLGLSIVKHILLRHQATLEVASVPGVGSTFSAVFPSWRVTLPQEAGQDDQASTSRLTTRSAS